MMKAEFDKFYGERTGLPEGSHHAWLVRVWRQEPKRLEWAYGKTEGAALEQCEANPCVLELDDLELVRASASGALAEEVPGE